MAIPMIKNNNGEWELVNIPFMVQSIPQHLSEEEQRQIQSNIGIGRMENDITSFSTKNAIALAENSVAFGSNACAGTMTTPFVGYSVSGNESVLTFDFTAIQLRKFVDQIKEALASSDVYFSIAIQTGATKEVLYRVGVLYKESLNTNNWYNTTDKTITLNTVNSYSVNISSSSKLSLIIHDWPLIGTEKFGGNLLANGTNAVAIGENSVAIGSSSQAIQDDAIAIGKKAIAKKNGIALGAGAKAYGEGSIALIGGTALKNESIAIGQTSYSQGSRSLSVFGQAEGQGSIALMEGTASGTNSFAMGEQSWAKGYNSIAMYGGTARSNSIALYNGYSDGNDSLAMFDGYVRVKGIALYEQSEAWDRYSVAIGYDNHARGRSTFALGEGLVNEDGNVFMIGTYNQLVCGRDWDDEEERYIEDPVVPVFVVGCGSSIHDRYNGLVSWSDGRLSVYEDPAREEDVVTLGFLQTQLKNFKPAIDTDDLKEEIISDVNSLIEEQIGDMETAIDEILALQEYYTGATFDELHDYATNVAQGGAN